jgi:membrane protease YdiL (CAAX protease family)
LTGPSTPEGVDPPVPEPTPALPVHARGLTDFTVEGRRAPALFVVGWLSIIAAVALASLGLFGPPGTGGSIFWLIAFAAASIGLILLGGSESLERRAAGASYAGPSPMLVLLTALVVTQVAGFAVGLPLQAVASQIPREVGDLIAVGVQAIVFVGVLRLMVVGTGALSWVDMGLVRWGRDAWRALLGGAVFAGPVIFATTLVALAAVALAGVIPESPLPPTGTATGLALHLLAGAILAPVAEEILFRGFALAAWRRTRGTRSAIIRSSIVFVLAHVLFVGGDRFEDAVRLAFVAGVVRLPVAFALGWLFVRTGSLWAPIGLHAAFNGVLILIAELGAGAAAPA